MAWNNYFPVGYQQSPYPQFQQPYQQTQQMPQASQVQQQSNINWVQGLEGAKAYPVGAGNDILLLDSDSDTFFIKSADQSGMPHMRVFEYHEITNKPPQRPQNTAPLMDMSGYVTKEEFEERLKELTPKKTTPRKREVKEDE